jgi:thioredoxin-like negative regulator of GroEL
MKKGPAILVLLTILITGAVFLLPKTEESSSEVMETEVSSEHDHSEGSGLFSVADSLVDNALNKLETGDLPPMQAVMAIADVAKKFPTNVKANFTLGVMSMQTGQYSKALNRFKVVLEEDPLNGDAYLLYARSQMFLGDSTAAKSVLEDALEKLSDETALKAIQDELATIINN